MLCLLCTDPASASSLPSAEVVVSLTMKTLRGWADDHMRTYVRLMKLRMKPPSAAPPAEASDQFEHAPESLRVGMPPNPPTIVLATAADIARGDLPRLYMRAWELLGHSEASICCDARGAPADALTVDAIAHIALAARRRGREVKLQGASRELLELIAFVGIEDVVHS